MRGGGGAPQPDLLGQPLVRGRDLARDPLNLAAVHRVLLRRASPVLLLPRRIRYLITVLSAMGLVRILRHLRVRQLRVPTRGPRGQSALPFAAHNYSDSPYQGEWSKAQ